MFQLSEEMTRVATKGTWVTTMVNSSAGSRGARRTQRAFAPSFGATGAARTLGAGPVRVVMGIRPRYLGRPDRQPGRPAGSYFWYFFATSWASACPSARALSTVVPPVIAALTC